MAGIYEQGEEDPLGEEVGKEVGADHGELL